jgi:hypothetical protein
MPVKISGFRDFLGLFETLPQYFPLPKSAGAVCCNRFSANPFQISEA